MRKQPKSNCPVRLCLSRIKINDEIEAEAGTGHADIPANLGFTLGYSRRAQTEKKFFEDCCAAYVFSPLRGLERTSPTV